MFSTFSPALDPAISSAMASTSPCSSARPDRVNTVADAVGSRTDLPIPFGGGASINTVASPISRNPRSTFDSSFCSAITKFWSFCCLE